MLFPTGFLDASSTLPRYGSFNRHSHSNSEMKLFPPFPTLRSTIPFENEFEYGIAGEPQEEVKS